ADKLLYGGAHRDLLISVLSGRGLLDPEHLDDTPADATPLTLPQTVSGHLNAATDHDDYYSVPITAGSGVVLRLSGAAGNFDLRLLRPGSTGPSQAGATVASSAGPSSNELLPYTASETGV